MKIVKTLTIIIMLSLSARAESYVTAEDAIRIGLEHNFDIRVARNNQQITENSAGFGTAGFLPILDVSAGESITRSLEESNGSQSFGDTDARQRFAQVSLDWLLFDGFRMFVSKKRFNELALLGKSQARNLIENTVVSILRSYFNLVQQEQLMDVVNNAIELSRTRLTKAEIRQELGGTSATDLLNARVSFNNDQALLIERQIQVQKARKDLNILLGRSPESQLQVENEILIEPLNDSVDNLISESLKRNSTLKLAEQSLNVARQEVNLARSSFYPSLFFSSSYGYRKRNTTSINNIFSEIETEGTDTYAGLTLSFNLFNGFRNRIELQNAKISRKNQMIGNQELQYQVTGLVQETFATFNKRVELINLEEENVKAAGQNLQLHEDRYELGTVSSLEFRDAQLNFIRAQSTLIVAKFQAKLSRLELDQLTGRIQIN